MNTHVQVFVWTYTWLPPKNDRLLCEASCYPMQKISTLLLLIYYSLSHMKHRHTMICEMQVRKF